MSTSSMQFIDNKFNVGDWLFEGFIFRYRDNENTVVHLVMTKKITVRMQMLIS